MTWSVTVALTAQECRETHTKVGEVKTWRESELTGLWGGVF